jgi:Family of unknown function (DUF6282)
MTSRTMSMAALAAFALSLTVVAHPETQGAGAGYVWPTPSEADLRLVRGALDLDVHADPDVAGPRSGQAPRGFDVLDIARRAKQLGMRGFAIKQHYDQSAALAYIARKEVPGLEVYGGVVQNLIVGGLNPASVYHLAEVKGGWGRIVWFPTFDSESNAKLRSRDGVTKPFVQILSGGELVQAAKDVIAALKAARTRDTEAELVLQTGYVTPEEALAIVREGNKQGVKHMVVSHAATGTSAMSVPQMQEAITLGALLEFASVSTMGASPEMQPAAYADLMRKVGVENVIMGSDFGQPGRPMPPDGLALFAGLMRQQGFSERDLSRMMAENPARALGLPPAASNGAH